MTIPRLILVRLIKTAALLWLMVRVAGIFLAIGSFRLPEMVAVTLLVLLLVWVDIRAFREPLLYGNLGISPLRVSGIVVSTALALDLVVALSLGAQLSRLTGN